MFDRVLDRLPISTNVAKLSAENERRIERLLLTLWAFGDSCNLVACVLTGDQTPVQMYTAVYFLMSDSVLISQFVLYRKRQQQREERQMRRRRRLSFNESIIREEEESPEDANENAVISATMARIDENISTA